MRGAVVLPGDEAIERRGKIDDHFGHDCLQLCASVVATNWASRIDTATSLWNTGAVFVHHALCRGRGGAYPRRMSNRPPFIVSSRDVPERVHRYPNSDEGMAPACPI